MYDITIADIRAYLSTLEPDQTAGTTHNAFSCLVACALNYKYSREDFVVGVTGFSLPDPDVPWFDSTPDIQSIVIRFDELGRGHEEISRSASEQAIPELGA